MMKNNGDQEESQSAYANKNSQAWARDWDIIIGLMLAYKGINRKSSVFFGDLTQRAYFQEMWRSRSLWCKRIAFQRLLETQSTASRYLTPGQVFFQVSDSCHVATSQLGARECLSARVGCAE
jgi:hypothetical protein